MKNEFFVNAKPIWLKNRRSEVNLQAGFRCDIVLNENRKLTLKITGATLYRVFVNGEFVHCGPARAAHGFLRVDELEIPAVKGVNRIAVEVAGYNCNSYYTIKNKSFVWAEIFDGSDSIAYTGKDFNGISLEKLRIKKVMRYSFQRNFTEVWHLDNNRGLADWTRCGDLRFDDVYSFEVTEKCIPRAFPLPEFDKKSARKIIEKGAMKERPPKEPNYRFINNLSCEVTGYSLNDIKERPVSDMNRDFLPDEKGEGAPRNCLINENRYVIYDFGKNNNGFISADVTAPENSEVYLFFGETMIDGRISFDRNIDNGINVVKYKLSESGRPYHIQTFESYGFKYLGVAVLSGKIEIEAPQLVEYSYPIFKNTEFECGDDKLNEIFGAAVETFRQNTLDAFMDCPTRERAGWLCDSAFTAKSEQLFTGKSIVEKEFLDNYVMAEEFPGVPSGMIPMCYPADHYNGSFIPQWALWYIIELEGYLKRSGDTNSARFKPLLGGLLAYFEKFENEDGLLEKLSGWNFIEWSDANKWTRDVNYPTNMLYSKALRIAADICGDKALLKKSDKLKETIIRQSFDGTFFTDNAVRDKNGELHITGNRSEICQYSAFYFGIADISDEKFRPLADIILNIFGPHRKEKGEMPDVAYANAFVGNYLRMELLSLWGKNAQLLEECVDYFHEMAKITGTLWELDSPEGSLNHGFASYIGVLILKSVTGLADIDNKNAAVTFCFENCPNIDAFAKIGVSGGYIEISRRNGKLKYKCPENYRIKII